MPSQNNMEKIGNALLKIAWFFGPKGLNGECCNGLNMPEFMALGHIGASRDCPVHAIGDFLGFTKSGATRIVNRLEKKGLVKRLQSSTDGRICCITILSAGQKILDEVDSQYRQLFSSLLKKMPEEGKKQAREAITALAEVL